MMKNKTGSRSGGGLFAKNAAILTATSLLLRAAGMIFRIYVSGLVGAEGMGLYQLIMSVYVLGSGFASSGIVVAVTRMTAEEMARGSVRSVRLVLKRCLMVSVSMGLLSAVIIAALSEPIGNGWISDPRSVRSVRVMAMALPFMSISCCLRGYFTARRKVSVPSAAQMTEQVVRIVLALVLLNRLSPLSAESACLAIMAADVISEAAGCLYITTGYLLERKKLTCQLREIVAPDHSMWREIWNIAAPITASHYLTTLLRTIESILVPDCLTRYELSRERALELFGIVKGMALPLILFPSTLLTAFSSLLVPEISEAAALGRHSRLESAITRSLHITMTFAFIISGIFILYPEELSLLIYNEPELADILRWLAPLMPLMYVESVVVGILRGLGEQNSSLRYGIIDSVVRILLIIATVPSHGLNGFMLVMMVSNLLTPLLHINRLRLVSHIRFDLMKCVIKPALSASLSCLLIKLGERFPLPELPTVAEPVLGAVFALCNYCALLWLTGAVTKDDFSLQSA